MIVDCGVVGVCKSIDVVVFDDFVAIFVVGDIIVVNVVFVVIDVADVEAGVVGIFVVFIDNFVVDFGVVCTVVVFIDNFVVDFGVVGTVVVFIDNFVVEAV